MPEQFIDKGRALYLTSRGLGWGALFGTVLGPVGYPFTGGRCDFTSRSQVVPSRYEVLADTDGAVRAWAELRPGRTTAVTEARRMEDGRTPKCPRLGRRNPGTEVDTYQRYAPDPV